MKKKTDFLALARAAAAVAADKKGRDIIILNVRRLTAVADYFVIVTAESTPQMNAILDGIQRTLKAENNILPIRREGTTSLTWSVLDYGGTVVHVMSPPTRAMYSLERIWSDARRVK